MNLAILSTTRLPRFLGDEHPDEKALFGEDDILAGALAARGIAARRVPWRAPGLDWAQFDVVLLRSTWDYIDDPAGFLATLRTIDAAGCRLINPLETVQWNIDKSYLRDLAESGLPMVPTAVWRPHADPYRILAELGNSAGGYIIKPTVAVGAFGTRRLADVEELAQTLAASTDEMPQLVQPFIESVVSEGEWSFVFGAGRFLYAALKKPRRDDFRVQVMYGARTLGMQPVAADLEVARRCYRALPVPAILARIDMVRLADGKLALMEAELIEPQLFFADLAEAADLVAEAVLSSVWPS